MKLGLKDIRKAYEILKAYDGENPYIIELKNNVYAYKTKSLTDFQAEFILQNHDKAPRLINKTVKMADWWANQKKDEWGTDFLPNKLYIGWFIGETENMYVFYAKYRKSIDAQMMFVPKSAVLTDFLLSDWTNVDVDFTPYNERSGRQLYPHQEDAVKFLITRKKAILAYEMGLGKTTSAIVAALAGNYKHVCVICPAAIKENWKSELLNYVDDYDITIVNGSTWDDARFTILNYDILDNFYTRPTQIIKQSELNVDENGKIVKEVKEKEITARKKSIVAKALKDSQLYQSHFDLFIIDEAHRLSNSSSGRFKIINDLVKRSKPDGIFELTGTMITNNAKNLYNLLKIIDCRVTNDWRGYMERYCGAKSFYKKGPRAAYSAMYFRQIGKKKWSDLTHSEQVGLYDYLDKHCPKITIPGESTNMEELQEIIKPYYLRRTMDELDGIPEKKVTCLHYNMNPSQKKSYKKIWDDYQSKQKTKEDKEKAEKYKNLIETSIFRQWLANEMIPKTAKLTKKLIKEGHKVIIFCAYDNEIEQFRDIFKDISVYHNGKVKAKDKVAAVKAFQTDPNIKVFIGNITSAGVGLTLTAADTVIFNNFDFVPANDFQCENRIHRIGQKKPCMIYYQSFNGTYFDRMLEIVHNKSEVIDKIIVTENEK